VGWFRLFSRVGKFLLLVPGNLVLLHPVTKFPIFLTGPRKNRDELPLAAIDVGHVCVSAELAVAHIDEVAVPDELPQIIPDGTVNLVVGRVPVEEAKVDRDILIC
jgi:hypothetical protein